MGDFRLRQPTFRYTPPDSSLSLGVGQLTLDPQIAAEIRSIRARAPSARLRNLILQPDWSTMNAALVSPLNAALAAQPTPSPAPLVPRGRGPATPRPGEVTDLMKAVWGIPTVQFAANRLLDRAAETVQRDWNRLTTGQQAALITQGALITGGAVAGAMSNPESRDFLLGLIMNRDIPVPGVPGLKFKILERGGSVSYNNILGSGISARGGASVSGMGQFQGEVHVGLDLARWVPLLK